MGEVQDFIIAPRELCQSCDSASGPRFALSSFRDTVAIFREYAPLTNVGHSLTEANVRWAQSEGASLDNEILRVQQSLQKLQDRRKAVRQFEELEKSLLVSHIRKLPVEILRHILILAHGGERFIAHDPDAFPRVLARVCSYWHSVVYNCAPLWANFTSQPPDFTRMGQYGNVLEKCLRLSNAFPPSFCLEHENTRLNIGKSCITALGQSAPRWKDVRFEAVRLTEAIFKCMPPKATLEHLKSLDLPPLHQSVHIYEAPELKKLLITGTRYLNYDSDSDDDFTDDPDARFKISSAPSLTHLRLQNIYLSLRYMRINWSQIIVFESDDVKYHGKNNFIRVIERMPNLISLTMRGAVTKAEGSITIRGFKTLVILGPHFQEIFDVIVAPDLKKLHVDAEVDPTFVTQVCSPISVLSGRAETWSHAHQLLVHDS